MASPNREELYRMAVTAAKKGQRKPARVMLQQLLSQNQNNTRAMIMMAKLSGPAERKDWLHKVLDVDPSNDEALSLLDKIDYMTVARRNKMIYRYGLGAGAALILVIAFVMIISAVVAPI